MAESMISRSLPDQCKALEDVFFSVADLEPMLRRVAARNNSLPTVGTSIGPYTVDAPSPGFESRGPHLRREDSRGMGQLTAEQAEWVLGALVAIEVLHPGSVRGEAPLRYLVFRLKGDSPERAYMKAGVR